MLSKKVVLLAMPILLLLITRFGIEIFVRLMPLRYSWIPSAAVYYMLIALSLLYARRKLNLRIEYGSFSTSTFPNGWPLVLGILLPALIPLGVFILNVKAVPGVFFIYIFLFSLVNPLFEESFWRGLLDALPMGREFRNLYSSFLFSFSHYFLWGSYWLVPQQKWIAAVISTFIMGILWMWFYQRRRNLVYTILSHVLVDIFNLSVALFYGLKLVTI